MTDYSKKIHYEFAINIIIRIINATAKQQPIIIPAETPIESESFEKNPPPLTILVSTLSILIFLCEDCE